MLGSLQVFACITFKQACQFAGAAREPLELARPLGRGTLIGTHSLVDAHFDSVC